MFRCRYLVLLLDDVLFSGSRAFASSGDFAGVSIGIFGVGGRRHRRFGDVQFLRRVLITTAAPWIQM
jgi:hypothetical protein